MIQGLEYNIQLLYPKQKYSTSTVLNEPRFTIPYQYPFPYTKQNLLAPLTNPKYYINLNESPFSIEIIRISTSEVIFNTTGFNFIYSDLYIEFTTTLPSQYFYGMGDRDQQFLYNKSGTYTIWATNNYLAYENGTPGNQKYGQHPVYLTRENSGKWTMVFWRNLNAMDFVLDLEQQTITYKVVGGIFELKFFMGNEYPDTAIKMYHTYIGAYTLLPFWAHGYHHSRWGFTNSTYLAHIIQEFNNYSIPLDCVYLDLDYMLNLWNFQVDTSRFNLSLMSNITSQVHVVTLVNADVPDNQSSIGYNTGIQYDIFIKDPEENSQPLLSRAWPGSSNFFDFNHPNFQYYWNDMLQYLNNQIEISGIWQDMNEIASFCPGRYDQNTNSSCYFPAPPPIYVYNDPEYENLDIEETTPESQTIKIVEKVLSTKILTDNEEQCSSLIPPFNSSNLPYMPGYGSQSHTLEFQTLALDAYHAGGVLELNYHGLNGFTQSVTSYRVLQNQTGFNFEQPYILSRTTIPGSGQFVTSWGGDEGASLQFMVASIPEIFNHQLFGIPMFGSDICGYVGNTSPTLCARWYQLGSFYPFMRNHNDIYSIPQEPWALGPDTLAAARSSIYLRYSILKWYYSVFVRNQGTGTVFRPLFFDFPLDENLLSLDSQFLIGSELMIAPALDNSTISSTVYFPNASKWFYFQNGSLAQDYSPTPTTLNITVPLNTTAPVYIKAGSIIPVQDIQNLTNITGLNNIFNLTIALSQDNEDTYSASGIIMGIQNYSDYTSLQECINPENCLVNLTIIANVLQNGTVAFNLTQTPQNGTNAYLQNITLEAFNIYGIRTKICPIYNNTCADTDHIWIYSLPTPSAVQLNSYYTFNY